MTLPLAYRSLARPRRRSLRGPVLFVSLLLCLFFHAAPALGADAAAKALAHAELLRERAARSVENAQRRVEAAKSELAATRAVEREARASGDRQALAVVAEALAEGERALREARELQDRAGHFLEGRQRALDALRRDVARAPGAGFVVSEGEGLIRRAADGAPIEGGPLQPGERLQTGASRARLYLADAESAVLLEPGCDLTVERDGEGGFLAFLERGLGRFKAKLRRKFEVRTPTVAIAVRGTDFSLEPLAGGTRLVVYEGVVAATPAGKKEAVEVPAGHALEPGSLAPAPFEGSPPSGWDQ